MYVCVSVCINLDPGGHLWELTSLMLSADKLLYLKAYLHLKIENWAICHLFPTVSRWYMREFEHKQIVSVAPRRIQSQGKALTFFSVIYFLNWQPFVWRNTYHKIHMLVGVLELIIYNIKNYLLRLLVYYWISGNLFKNHIKMSN